LPFVLEVMSIFLYIELAEGENRLFFRDRRWSFLVLKGFSSPRGNQRDR